MNSSYKILFNITLLLSLATNPTLALDATKAPEPKDADITAETKTVGPAPTATKVETAPPVAQTAKKEAPKPEAKKTELPKEEPKPEIKVTTEEKKVEVKQTPVAAAKKPAALFNNLEKLQADLMALITEADAYVKTNPADREKVLEQFGIVFGMTIGALEKISGEKILEALEAPELPEVKAPEAKKISTKKTQRQTGKEKTAQENGSKKANTKAGKNGTKPTNKASSMTNPLAGLKESDIQPKQ